MDLPINKIIEQLREAAQNNEGIALSASEVEILVKAIGKGRFIPVYTGQQIAQLVEEGKLGQKMVISKE